jgi:hypothetical protein
MLNITRILFNLYVISHPPPIYFIRYSYRTRCCIRSQFYWSPDDGHGTCPKHVEIDKARNKVLWRDILLVFLDKIVRLVYTQISPGHIWTTLYITHCTWDDTNVSTPLLGNKITQWNPLFRHQITTAVGMKITVSCATTPCSLANHIGLF